MRDPRGLVANARWNIGSGRYLIDGEFFEQAGRDGYMATFHSALAYILQLTGREPKTHRGTHVEFARLARERGDVAHEHVGFLSHAYELKDIADYSGDRPVSQAEAEAALQKATSLIDHIERLLPPQDRASDP